MRLRLFWKIGLPYLILLVVVLAAVNFYTARVLEERFLRAAYEQLDSLSHLVESRPPRLDDPVELQEWADWMAESGARATVIRSDGTVLADSHESPSRMENHADRPEIIEAFASGRGRSARHSATLNRDMVYLAVRHHSSEGEPIVLRLAWPLERVNEALVAVLRPVATVSILFLLLAGLVSMLFSRVLSLRVQKLKEFSRRVAEGDFRPIRTEKEGDELVELSRALNDTAVRLDETIRTLRDERNKSAAILGSMSEGVVVVGPDERIAFCNQAFRDSLNLGTIDCEGRAIEEIARQTELLELIHDALSGSDVVQKEFESASPRPRHYQVRAAPVKANGATAAVLVLHDITEIRRVEQVRRDFVVNVSHEFKTPLTAIQGFAETLLGGALDDPRNSRRFLEIIRDHSIRLTRLTNDLLKLSQIETGKLDLHLRTLAIPDLVEACLETAKYKAEPKGLVLINQCPSTLPRVLGDRHWLREVLQNLLDNAIQYTPAGGRISVEGSTTNGQVRISIVDTGIGILQEELGRVFERFYRTEAARSLEAGGTGLGLAIAKHLMEAHEGWIEVESVVGRGSSFTIYLPKSD